MGLPDLEVYRLVDFCTQDFERRHPGVSLAGNPTALRRLHAQCLRAVAAPRVSAAFDVDFDCLHEGIDYSCKLFRARFDQP
eukprot:1013112-Alexandrium_andersonii.AAC.1